MPHLVLGDHNYAFQREEMVITIRNTERDFRGIVYTPRPSRLTEIVNDPEGYPDSISLFYLPFPTLLDP